MRTIVISKIDVVGKVYFEAKKRKKDKIFSGFLFSSRENEKLAVGIIIFYDKN